MKYVLDEFETDEFNSRMTDLYFHGLKLCVYDIETTGLFPRSDRIMLTGLLTVEGGKARAEQFFAETLNDEKEIIEKTLEVLNKADVVVTYNGRSFDIPFTRTRAARYGIKYDMPYDLDLFMIVGGYSEIKKTTGSLSQKSIEKYMGAAPGRDDRIDGRESIRLYEQYLECPSYALEKTIMLHNHDDICQLYRILPVILQTDFHRAMSRLGFPAGPFTIKNYRISSGTLIVEAEKREDPSDYISFPTEDAPYSLWMSSADGKTELEIPCDSLDTADGRALVIDARRIAGDLAGLEEYPAFESGYLIVKNANRINYLEINMFIKKFLSGLGV